MKAPLLELLGSCSTLEQLDGGVCPTTTTASWAEQIEQFHQVRKKYLIYSGN